MTKETDWKYVSKNPHYRNPTMPVSQTMEVLLGMLPIK